MNSNFYIPATSPVKNVIRSLWQIEGFTSFRDEHILPKGIVEVIFNFGDGHPTLAKLGGKQDPLYKCFINGFNTTPVKLQLPDHQKFFGVQLQPLAVKKLLGVPAGEFANQVVDLALLDTRFHSLWHQLAEQKNFDDRVSVFINWIEGKFPVAPSREDMINHFLSGIDLYDWSVKELANTLCYSPRQLSRKLAEATGMNTEEILLYKKYLHAMHLVHHTDLSLTKIAYQSHFSDQSHFIRSFKTFAGMTPGDYKRSKGTLKGHIYDNVR